MATVGSIAPDFDLPCTRVAGSTRDRARLADYRGKWLLLVFYPRDFSLVCPTELIALSRKIEQFRDRGCEILGVSCDPVELHEKWIAMPRAQGGLGGLGFPLASDLDGRASRAYGVFLAPQNVALRGLFIIDANGVLEYQVVHNLSVGRRTDEVLRVLAALQTGGLCAEDWSFDDATLDDRQQFSPGTIVSHYRIERRVGEGSFAAVYRARDMTLQRNVALKVIKPGSPLTPTTLLAEARSAAALNHPSVCTIFSVDDYEGTPIIAMEYLEGEPLSKALSHGPLDRGRVARIGRQVAEGISAAHALGIVHGDLKPANIMIAADDRAKVLDFGLACRHERNPVADETIVLGMAEGDSVAGTPYYMAPEQTRGQRATAASDVFSLAVILFEMLTGHRAFEGDNLLHVMSLIRQVEPERYASAVPEPFDQVLLAALHRDPNRRIIDMPSIAQRLAT